MFLHVTPKTSYGQLHKEPIRKYGALRKKAVKTGVCAAGKHEPRVAAPALTKLPELQKLREEVLQEHVAKYLDSMAALTGRFAWSHPPNESKRKPQHGAKLKRAGMKAGEPDCIIFAKGSNTFFIELKVLTGRLSDNQKARHAVLGDVGYRVHVVIAKTIQDGIDQVESILKGEGVL